MWSSVVIMIESLQVFDDIKVIEKKTKVRPNGKKYFIETYGCQMNVADSELIEQMLIKEGYKNTANIKKADILMINTCSIRDHAEDKVHSQLGRYRKLKQKKPSLLIGVVGCMAQSLKHELLENKPYVDIILGPDSYRNLPKILNRSNLISKNIVDTKLSRFEVYDDLFPSRKEGINAWISIMRGCDKFCTFCIVPFTRGRERSRTITSIVSEAEQAVSDGFVEITLLGQNVNSYRCDGFEFHHLLNELAKINGLKRIRYTSPHPKDINIDLLNTMSKNDNICNHIHLPLQSGSDYVLKRMNRTYTRDQFLLLAHKIRTILPGVGISTDIIVGFPGEKESDFKDTIDLMSKIKFDSAFMFKYSKRRGTKAVEYDDQINEDVKQKRLSEVIDLQKKHTLYQNKKMIGKVEKVLIEKISKKSDYDWAGRTESNKWVNFNMKNEKIGDEVNVKILSSNGISLKGKIL